MKYISIMVILATLAGCYGTEPEKTGLEGKVLPDFNLQLPDSTVYFNTRQIEKGKAFAIFYFSPMCPYCRAQTNDIIENIDKLKDVQVFFVTSFPFSAMKRFYKDHQLAKYPNIVFGKDTADFIPKYFDLSGVPFTAVYGEDKKLKKAFLGQVNSKDIKNAAKE